MSPLRVRICHRLVQFSDLTRYVSLCRAVDSSNKKLPADQNAESKCPWSALPQMGHDILPHQGSRTVGEKRRQKDYKSPREVRETRAGRSLLDMTGLTAAVLPVRDLCHTSVLSVAVEWGGAHGPHPNWGDLQILMASRWRRDILQGCAAWWVDRSQWMAPHLQVFTYVNNR